jgi:hypothetical protein
MDANLKENLLMPALKENPFLPGAKTDSWILFSFYQVHLIVTLSGASDVHFTRYF